MDSELVDEVWRRLLASEEAQQLVERIAEAPEVRAAISAQGVGLLEDIGRTIGSLARAPRRQLRADRPPHLLPQAARRCRPTTPAPSAAAWRSLIDGVFVNLGFTAFVALVTLVGNAFGGSGERRHRASRSPSARPPGSRFGALYLVGFWSLAGQTPGMRFVGIRLDGERLPLRRSLKRLIGLGLSVVTFGLGFLGIVFRERRRGWDDRFAGTDVVYDERRPEPAPWSSAGRVGGAPKPEPPSGSEAIAAPAG